jgi:toxin-antitoxin system PIN domain toxin
MAQSSASGAGDLPDLNVWLALLNANHPHHGVAKKYWDSLSDARMFFCRITMLGLLRLSTNKAVMGGAPYTTTEAWPAYRSVAAMPEVGFFAEPLGIESAMEQFTQSKGFTHADWTDAYLAGFARLAGLRLVSFDNGFSKYKELSWQLLA